MAADWWWGSQWNREGEAVLRKKEGCVVDVATLVDAIRLFFFFRRWEGVRW